MDKAILGRLLKNVPIFEDVDFPLDDIVKRMTLKSFEKDQDIFKEGEACNGLYIIIIGKVLIYSTSDKGRDQAKWTLGQTGFFGEKSFWDGGKRPVGARALEKTIASCLERENFIDYLNDNPLMAIMIIESLGRKLRRLSEDAGKELVSGDSHKAHVKRGKNKQAGRALEGEAKNCLSLSETLEKRLEEVDVFSEETEQATAQKKLCIEDMLYNKKVTCQVCDSTFETPKVRSRYIRVKKIDNDFCKHYETINPLYYEIAVCPVCGFAFDEDASNVRVRSEQKERARSILTDIWRGHSLKDYRGERSLEQAIETFLLAVLAMDDKQIKSSKKAMVFLKVAWLYRYKEDEANEQKYIEKAASLLEHAYETENFADKRSEINIPFLLGVLNVRLNKYQGAGKWLERVIRHPANVALPMVLDRARELWGEVRQKLREEC